MPWPNCDVCGEPAFGVFCSSLGPISHAYCTPCIQKGLEPWETLVGAMWGIGREGIDSEYKLWLRVICDFHKKTEEDLWAAVDKLDREYSVYCAENSDRDYTRKLPL